MRRFKHLSRTDRIRIETYLNAGKKPKEIAVALSVHISTVYREIQRGQCENQSAESKTATRYSPDVAEAKYRAHLAAKGARLKIGFDRALADYIENKIINNRYSPRAVLGEIQRKNLKFNVTITASTLYSYIDKGIFLHLTNKNLPDKPKRKRKYKKVKVHRPPQGESIEKRPKEVDTRESFGHWEMDTVEGKKGVSKTRLLVLTERKTRQEIGIKIADGTAASVVRALDTLERKMGELFSKIFLTITVDNGAEFSDCAGIERSIIRQGTRTKAYYCHPYSSYERGSNEKQNRMLRRYFPKGTNFDTIPQSEIDEIQIWLNNYPRGIFNYSTSQYLFDKELQTASNPPQN